MYFPGIEAFLAIVQTGSISKAAELLHLSQATVSYRLKTLEKEMGGLLVERRKGAPKISLTPKGEDFLVLRNDGMLCGGRPKSCGPAARS